MKIVSIDAKGVHGYLNISVRFDEYLTFITGINGSGKTSAVRLIIALLGPSLRELASIRFSSAALTLESDGNLIIIAAAQVNEMVSLTCSTVTDILTYIILSQDKFESRLAFQDRETTYYQELESRESRHPVLLAIDSLPTPMYLDLDRRHYSDQRRRRRHQSARSANADLPHLRRIFSDSLSIACELAEDAYRERMARRIRLTDDLKQKIVLSAFDLTYLQQENIPSANLTFLRNFQAQQTTLSYSLLQIGLTEQQLKSRIEPFYDNIRTLSNELETQNMGTVDLEFFDYTLMDDKIMSLLSRWYALRPQVIQVSRLLQLIRTYNKNLDSLFAPVNAYLESVNRFLRDSGKEIEFDADGRLRIRVANSPTSRSMDLSSGERQLVVILTHLAFNSLAKAAKVLVIDEPELSLHVRWQEHFVDALTQAGRDFQLILATHSPSIIKGRNEYCVDVRDGI